MKLDEVQIKRFRHLIDTKLKLNPNITVLVGKNDTGKSSILSKLFCNYIKPLAFAGSDLPKLKKITDKSIEFSAIWRIEEDDFNKYKLNQSFSIKGLEIIKIDFYHAPKRSERKTFSFYLNGKFVNAYKKEPNEHGQPILKREFSHFLDNIIPLMRYINLSDRHLLIYEFEARFKIESEFEMIKPREFTKTEELLLGLAGIKAEIRGTIGVDKPWPWHHLVKQPTISLEEIESRLNEVSKNITHVLNEWWKDPPNLKFEIKLAGKKQSKENQHKRNSYLFIIEITDDEGLTYYGTGLRWFIAFIVEYSFLMSLKQPVMVLFDEPAYNLHPSAQRLIAKLLNKLSNKFQIIYSTHSPFILDWNFPQRIRHLERDLKTKVTKIDNKPYIMQKPYISIWDRFKDSIGISFSDVGFLGEKNIFVEGISDQILLANISFKLEKQGKKFIDLDNISIIPFGSDTNALKLNIKIAQSQNREILVLCDKDEEGKKIINSASKFGIKCILIGNYIESKKGKKNYSIEDIFGYSSYLEAVNSFYLRFRWFDHAISKKDLDDPKIGIDSNETLGKKVEEYFKRVLNKDFAKYEISVFIADSLDKVKIENEKNIEDLIEDINAYFN